LNQEPEDLRQFGRLADLMNLTNVQMRHRFITTANIATAYEYNTKQANKPCSCQDLIGRVGRQASRTIYVQPSVEAKNANSVLDTVTSRLTNWTVLESRLQETHRRQLSSNWFSRLPR
jgi:hypothetical protein